MRDQFGREITYLRVSVTDRCNLHCAYCSPGTAGWLAPEVLLTFPELRKVCKAAGSLGIRRFKITGGEPLLRPGLADFIASLKREPFAEEVTLTTNATLLAKHLPTLLNAGLDRVTVSLDTLNPERYRALTGGELAPALRGIKSALRPGLPVKLNAVLCGQPLNELLELVELTKDNELEVRFIAQMPLGQTTGTADASQPPAIHTASALRAALSDAGFCLLPAPASGNGPAARFTVAGHAGSLGFIDALSEPFCTGCNRLRLTADGQLKPCLYYKESIDLKPILREQTPAAPKLLAEAFTQAIRQKPERHRFDRAAHPDAHRETLPMHRIGG